MQLVTVITRVGGGRKGAGWGGGLGFEQCLTGSQGALIIVAVWGLIRSASGHQSFLLEGSGLMNLFFEVAVVSISENVCPGAACSEAI